MSLAGAFVQGPCSFYCLSFTLPPLFIPFLKTVNAPASHEHLAVKDIDHRDTTYQLSPAVSEPPDAELIKSIKQYGILHPPLVRHKQNHGYIVLSGKKRIIAAKQLGFNAITCLIIHKNQTEHQAWELLLQHAGIGSQLSIIEQANFFKKTSVVLPEERILSYLPLLGYKSNPFKIREFTTLLSLEKSAIVALHEGCLHQKSGIKLASLSHLNQQQLIGLVREFHLGGAKQQKLIDYAIELIKREKGQSLSQIVKKWRQGQQRSNNMPQLAASLFQWLHGMCFPRMVAAEEQFKVFSRSLHLPDGVQVHHTLSFEDDAVILSITFDGREALREGWLKIKETLYK
ncbi:MAG: hypothetical protein GQ559_01285 [Desulfobulbaceae bacterium]|nr:hypothetical protein [Desulfobulbaceae bacterium]